MRGDGFAVDVDRNEALLFRGGYNQAMSRVALGKVVKGQVVVEGEPLPEGARVVVHVGEEADWDLDEDSVQELLQAAAEAGQEAGISPEQLIAELRAMH